MIRKPKSLKAGDRIGVVSPAGPVAPWELDPGLQILRKNGFRVRLGPHVFDGNDYLAGPDSDRLSDFHAMFLDPEIRAVFCARGGYGSMRLLNRIDFGLIKAHPRIFLGYSDITALLLATLQKTGMVTFHGPMVKGLSSTRSSDRKQLLALLGSREPSEIEPAKAHVLSHGTAEGRLLGGNLSLLCHLLGTPYMPSLKGSILFLEDTGEPPYRLDRMLMHLYLAGVFEDVTGLILGRFANCGDETVMDRLVNQLLSNRRIPVMAGFPVGHGAKNVTLPLGIPTRLYTRPPSLQFLQSPVT